MIQNMVRKLTMMPGLRAPAFVFVTALAALAVTPAAAQQRQPQQPMPAQQPASSTRPPISAQPVPGELELAKLIWSTMVGLDQANRSGNYSVLRDNSATGFQINNDPARLTQIFAALRATRIDLANTLLVPPSYLAAPRMAQADVLQVQGFFSLRPTAIAFDLLYQWERGDWRLFGITVEPRGMAPVPGISPPAAPPQPPARRRN